MTPFIPDDQWEEHLQRIDALEAKKLKLKDLPYESLIEKLATEQSFKGSDLLLKKSVGAELLGDGSVTSDALADNSVDERVLALAAPSWTAPTLLNSWVNHGGSDEDAGYYKDEFGRVYLRGVVKNGTPSITSVVFTLPSEHRPPVGLWFPATSNGAYATVNVQSDGDVIAVNGSNSSFSLSAVSFSTI